MWKVKVRHLGIAPSQLWQGVAGVLLFILIIIIFHAVIV